MKSKATSSLTTLIVSYNTRSLLDPCLQALAAAQARVEDGEFSGRVVIVDNASRDGSVEYLQTHHPEVKLISSPENIGFGRANNLALSEVDTAFVLLLNTDAFVEPESLKTTLAYMRNHPDCGILGVRLTGRDGDLQPSCRYFPTPLNLFLIRTGLARLFPRVPLVDDMAWDHAQARECDWVPGCFYLVRREVIDQVGLFDPRYFLYFEEVDHCLAAKRAGWKVVYCPDTTVVHIGGESARADGPISESGRQVEVLQIESALLYFRKNHGLLGMLAHVVFEQIADGLSVCKAVVKGRGLKVMRYHLGRMASTVVLAIRTRAGTCATR